MTVRACILATLCLLSAPGGANAQELGRVFFTPEQRAALDARRKARVPDKPAAVPQVEAPVTRINGAVRRGSGNSTVWINGQPVPESPQEDSARFAPRQPGADRVTIPAGEGGQRYDLRVGQSLDRGSGEVRDVIGEGEIRVAPARAPARRP